MFKKISMAAAAVAAFAAVAPAHAATVVYGAGGQTINLVGGTDSATGGFNFQVQADNSGSNAFTASYTFDNTFYDPAQGTSSVTFTGSHSDIDFTGATLGGLGGFMQIDNNAYSGFGATIFVFNGPIPLGSNTLTVSGNLTKGTLSDVASGQLTLTAVPEPAAWALMLLGFGVVGFSMRRRNATVRSTRASFDFA